jgi:hypothetical protein
MTGSRAGGIHADKESEPWAVPADGCSLIEGSFFYQAEKHFFFFTNLLAIGFVLM